MYDKTALASVLHSNIDTEISDTKYSCIILTQELQHCDKLERKTFDLALADNYKIKKHSLLCFMNLDYYFPGKTRIMNMTSNS